MNRLTTLALACLVVLTAGTTGALAQENAPADGAVQVAGGDVTISDATISVGDVDLTGTGLPDQHIDHAEYTVQDATIGVDGFTATVNGQEYRVGQITVTLRDVGVTVSDVSMS